MDEFPMVDVLKVRALDQFKLWLRFTDGCEGVRDLSELVNKGGPMVEPLRAPEFLGGYSWKWAPRLGQMASISNPINLYMNMRKSGDLRHVAVA